MRAIGNALKLTKEDFERCCVQADDDEESVSLVKHDVPRTFHRLELFVNPKESFTVDLVCVLESFARQNKELGYVQGMSYVAGTLLLNLSPYECWLSLNNFILNSHLFMSIFQMNVSGIVQHARLYEMILSETMPEVYAHLKELQITSDHYLLDWWMTVFSRKLPLRCVCRIWDLYLIGGEIQLHKTAVALMKLHKERVLKENDFEMCVKELGAPIDEIKEDEFMTMVDNVKVSATWQSVIGRVSRNSLSSPLIKK